MRRASSASQAGNDAEMVVLAAYSFGKLMLVIGLFAVMGLCSALQNSIFRRGRRRKAERERR